MGRQRMSGVQQGSGHEDRVFSVGHCPRPGELLNLEGAKGIRIAARSGTVWVTRDGNPRDIVLRSGESFELDRATTAIVQAIEAATIGVADPAARAPRRGRFAAWLLDRERRPAAGSTPTGACCA